MPPNARQHATRSDPFPHRAWIPWFVLAFCLLLTATGTLYVYQTANARDRERFTGSVLRTMVTIEDRLRQYVTMLRGGAGLFAASPSVTAAQFAEYVDRLQLPKLYPGIQGIGFTRRVLPEEKEQLVNEMRRQGVTGMVDGVEVPFHIWPDYPRDAYHAIVYLRPLDRRNHHAIGYDMFTEPTRREAMERARDQAGAAASGWVRLVQEIDAQKQAGLLLYLPIYRGGTRPDTVEGRRELLDGFVYSPFRADDLLAGLADPHVDLLVYDGSAQAADRLLHRSDRLRPPVPSTFAPRYSSQRQLTVAGRPWTLAFRVRPEFDDTSDTPLLPLVPILGVLISSVLFFATRSLSRAHQAAHRTATELASSEQALRSSEARLRRIVEANLTGVVFFRLDGTVTEANEAYLRLVGRDRADSDLPPLRWDRMTAPEYFDVERRALAELREKGVCTPVELDLLASDGRRVPVLVAAALLDGGGEEGVALVVDLTERKRAEEERLALLQRESTARRDAENAQHRLAFLADATKILAGSLDYEKTLRSLARLAVPVMADWCLVYALDEDRRIRRMAVVHASPARRSLADALREQPIDLDSPGLPVALVLRSGRPILLRSLSEQEIKNWGLSEEHVSVLREAGMRSAVIVPLVAEGRVIGAIALIHAESGRHYENADLALAEELAGRASAAVENARLYRAATQARAEAEHANRLKDEFLATVSHELRTPLNAILGWTQLLRGGRLDAESFEQALTTVERNAKAQAQLIDDLLDVSRIISGKLRIQVQPVDLGTVVEAALATVRPAADARHIRIEYHTADPVPPVSGDPHRLQQVAWNLLSNAIKFTPPGGRVEIRLGFSDGHVELVVHDTGQGIPLDFQPFLFRAFRQADASTTRKHSGLGLGLAIVRHLVELHGGTIHAHSAGHGQGATFTVRMPARQQSLREQEPPPSPSGLPRAASRPDAADGLSGVRVLAVDDELDARELVRQVLADAGANVVTAASGDEAISIVRDFRPHVLISDIAMPGEDGYNLLQRVRQLAEEQGGRIPAIALTAFARQEDRRRALAAGFAIHLSKPIEAGELRAAVARVARGYDA